MGKIPWRRKWQPTLVFLPGKSHGQRSPCGHKRVGHDLVTKYNKPHIRERSALLMLVWPSEAWLPVALTKKCCGSIHFRNFQMTLGATAPRLLRGPVVPLNSNHLKSFMTILHSFVPELFTGLGRKSNEAGVSVGGERGGYFHGFSVYVRWLQWLWKSCYVLERGSWLPACGQVGDGRPGN